MRVIFSKAFDMSNSIFEIDPWVSGGTFYQKNSIVLYNGYYYYAKVDNTSASVVLTNPITKPDWWGGVGSSPYDGGTKQEFMWTPSYSGRISHNPSVRSIKFDDGYGQDIPSNIYNDLLSFDLTFDKRNTKEATAISHFFHNLGGAVSFVWIPQPPYATAKLFKCKQWDLTHNFHDNMTITAKFEEANN